ncbi:hypothetical protein [Microbacterium sp. SLBN-111]|uniref:hypothetical protein n=1 Tax=Microbacterium sp. SLBN-111 TaxID=3377733 RepID=UPI003C70B571
MRTDEFHDIVDAEHLRRFLYEGAPNGSTSSKVCVVSDGAQWVTVCTDERAAVITKTRKTFDSQLEALDDAVDALRLLRDFEECGRA